MKVIKYQVLGYTDVWNSETEEVEQKECLSGVECPYSEEACQKALAEAYNGEYTIEEVPETAEEARARRDKLLADTDWTQVLDAPIDEETKASYRAYRQALRDVPQQEGFPETIIWPELPEKVKAAPEPVDEAVELLLSGATGEEASA